MKLFLVYIALLLSCTAIQKETVYITKTGEKYHRESCRYLKYSKKAITLEEAINRGYDLCSVCKPLKPRNQKANNQPKLKK